jgi:hypothetical protein
VLDRATHTLLREHSIAKKGERAFAQDRLPQTPPSIFVLQRRCDELGPAVGAFALGVITQRGAEAHRTLLDVIDLARRYDVVSLEAAYALAAQAQSTQLSLLRSYLIRHGKPIALERSHPVIPDFNRYIVHFIAATTKGVPV